MDDNSLKYNPESPYFGQPGYLNSLTDAQIIAMDDLQKWIVDECIVFSDLSLNSLHPKLTLLRYLRANKFDVNKAKIHILTNIAWRRENRVKEVCSESPESILGCSLIDLVTVFPHWHSGFDKNGRPVLYKQYSKFDTNVITSISTIDALSRYHIWEQECCMRLCYEQSQRTGYIVETCTAVFDIDQMTVGQVTRDFLTIVKTIAEIDQSQYPETLGQFFIINAPSTFPFVWRMIKAFLDPVVASKIQIFGSNREDWMKGLDTFIGLENVPSTYGGSLPELSPSRHPYRSIVLDGGGSEHGGEGGDGDDVAHANTRTITLAQRMQDVKSGRVPLGRDDSFKGLKMEVESSCTSGDFHDAVDYAVDHADAEHENWSKEIEFMRRFTMNKNDAGHEVKIPAENLQDANCLLKMGNSVLRAIMLLCKLIFHSIYYVVSTVFELLQTVLMSYSKLIPKFLSNQPTDELLKWFQIALFLFFGLTILSIALSGYALSQMYWETNIVVQHQMWSGVIVLAFSTLLAVINFLGYIGVRTKNTHLLLLYSCCLVFCMIFFLVIGLVCLTFITNNPAVTGVGNEALSQVNKGEKISTTLREYNIILSVLCMFLSFFSSFPLVLALALCDNFRREEEEEARGEEGNVVVNAMSPLSTKKLKEFNILFKEMNQLRSIVSMSQLVSIIISLVMIVYGGYSLNFLLAIGFDFPVFSIYLLLVGGVTTLIGACFGMWSAYSSVAVAIRFYIAVILPIIVIVILLTVIFSFNSLPIVDQEVVYAYDGMTVNRNKYSIMQLQSIVQIQLLVSGVLAVTSGLFQIVCITSALKLHNILLRFDDIKLGITTKKETLLAKGFTMNQMRNVGYWSVDDEALERLISLHVRDHEPLSFIDKVAITWSYTVGLVYVYLSGTFVIFAHNVKSNKNFWLTSIWQFLGKYDNRYVIADDYLVSANGILALIIGPLLFIYGCNILSRSSYRSVIGIIVSSAEVYSEILYFAVVIANRFYDISLRNTALFVFMFLIFNFLRILLPMLIGYREISIVVSNLAQLKARRKGDRRSDIDYYRLDPTNEGDRDRDREQEEEEEEEFLLDMNMSVAGQHHARWSERGKGGGVRTLHDVTGMMMGDSNNFIHDIFRQEYVYQKRGGSVVSALSSDFSL